MYLVCADKYVTGGGPQAAEKARILLKLMQFIGAVSGGRTVTQVALNYLMCKGKRSSPVLTCMVMQCGCIAMVLQTFLVLISDKRRSVMQRNWQANDAQRLWLH